MQNKSVKEAIIVGIVIVLIAIIPLFIVKAPASPEGAEAGEEIEMFGGADTAAEGAIGEVNTEYEPWFESLWEPPSGEIESLLFSLQVAIGAIFIGYVFGVVRERRRLAKK